MMQTIKQRCKISKTNINIDPNCVFTGSNQITPGALNQQEVLGEEPHAAVGVAISTDGHFLRPLSRVHRSKFAASILEPLNPGPIFRG